MSFPKQPRSLGPAVVLIESSDSESSDSIIEVEKPPKPIPPLVELTDDTELILNVTPASDVIFNTCTTENRPIYEIDALSDHLSPYHWTREMRLFYNADWGNETSFIVTDLQSKMKKNARLWEISPRDSYKSARSIRCRKCGGSGHIEKNCSDRFRPKMCHMCGGVGHYSNLCPKTICLTCGGKKRDFVNSCHGCERQRAMKCRRCGLDGHSIVDCTDNWRRFHNTVEGTLGDVKIPEALGTGGVNKPWVNLWCCNCGAKGHDSFNCRLSSESGFPKAFPFVVFYEKQIPVPLEVLQDGPPPKMRYFQVSSREENTHSNHVTQRAHDSSSLLSNVLPLIASPPPSTSHVVFKAPPRKPDAECDSSEVLGNVKNQWREKERSGFKTRYFHSHVSESRAHAPYQNRKLRESEGKKKKKKNKVKKLNATDAAPALNFIPLPGRKSSNNRRHKQFRKQNKLKGLGMKNKN